MNAGIHKTALRIACGKIAAQKHRWKICIALCCATLAISGCAYSTSEAFTSDKESSIPLQTIRLATHCFGRYLIDIPNAFKFRQRYAHRAGDIGVTHNMSLEMFNALVQKSEAQLKAKPMLRGEIGNHWYIDTLTRNPTQKIIRYYKDGISNYGTDLDGYVFTGNSTYKFSISAGTKTLDNSTKIITDTLSSVRKRGSHEIPTVPGFCINGGFIQGNDNVYESVAVSMAPDNQPAVHISFNTSTPNAVAPGLLAREDAVKGFFRNFTKLRRGKKTINGIEGEESLLSSINDQGDAIHYFTWDSYHRSAENRRPAISDLASISRTPEI